MARVTVGSLLALSATLFAVATAAQDPIDPQKPQTCQSLSSASRTRANCGSVDEEPVVESAEKELTLSIERPLIMITQCQATMNIEYLQVDTIARVTGRIDNEDCAASSGQYTIQARIRDEDGNTKTIDFSESWQRSDDQPVRFTTEYPIGENVELLRMRSSGLRCECAEPAAPPEQREPATVDR